MAVDLRSFIRFSAGGLSKSYTKDSWSPIPADEVSVTNMSDSLTIDVGLVGIAGVTFSPNTFRLSPYQSQTFTVSYDLGYINQYSEGVNTINAVVNLSTGTVVTVPPPPPPPPPPTGDPIPPTVPGPGGWLEERFYGAPITATSTTPIENIYAQGAFLVQRVPYISYGDGSLPAPVTVRWTGDFVFEDKEYIFTANSDDWMRVKLDNEVIFESSFALQPTPYYASRTIKMSPRSFNFVVEYFNGHTSNTAVFAWQATDPWEIIVGPTGGPKTFPSSPTEPLTQPTAPVEEPATSGTTGGGGGTTVTGEPIDDDGGTFDGMPKQGPIFWEPI
jgi:hypothetical protein